MAGSGPLFERRQLEPSKIFLLNSFHSKLRMKNGIPLDNKVINDFKKLSEKYSIQLNLIK